MAVLVCSDVLPGTSDVLLLGILLEYGTSEDALLQFPLAQVVGMVFPLFHDLAGQFPEAIGDLAIRVHLYDGLTVLLGGHEQL